LCVKRKLECIIFLIIFGFIYYSINSVWISSAILVSCTLDTILVCQYWEVEWVYKTRTEASCSRQFLYSWQIKYSFHAYQSSKDSVELRRKQMNDPYWRPPPLCVVNVSIDLLCLVWKCYFKHNLFSPICSYFVSHDTCMFVEFTFIVNMQIYSTFYREKCPGTHVTERSGGGNAF